MRFASPELLLLLLLVPLVLVVLWQRSSGTTVVYSSIRRVSALGGVRRQRHLGVLAGLRMLALSLLVVAVARPQIAGDRASRQSSGIDIMLAIDASGSMKGQDFQIGEERVSRLDAVRSVVRQFVAERTDDRIGLVVFGEHAFTQCPLTLNHDVLVGLLDGIAFGVAGDTTAIGNALARSVLRLKDSEAPSKVVILLSDGVSNAGNVPVEKAIEAAQAFDIKVHSIGIGTGEETEVAFTDPLGIQRMIRQEVELDEEALARMAEATGGRYFKAGDTTTLAEVYEEIDALETATFDEDVILSWKELFPFLLAAVLVLLGVEALLARTRYLKVP